MSDTLVKKAAHTFITPDNYLGKRSEELESTEGKLLIAGLDSGKALADSIVEIYRTCLRENGSDLFTVLAVLKDEKDELSGPLGRRTPRRRASGSLPYTFSPICCLSSVS